MGSAKSHPPSPASAMPIPPTVTEGVNHDLHHRPGGLERVTAAVHECSDMSPELGLVEEVGGETLLRTEHLDPDETPVLEVEDDHR
jgi:hypothetical protein